MIICKYLKPKPYPPHSEEWCDILYSIEYTEAATK